MGQAVQHIPEQVAAQATAPPDAAGPTSAAPSDASLLLELNGLTTQRRQARNIWTHLLRDVTRVSVLIASDLGLYFLVRACIWTIRSGVLGTGVAEAVSWAFPAGFLGGLRFAGALILSLAIAGSYGSGDARRDSSRLVTGASLAALISLYGAFWGGAVVATLLRGAAVTVVFAVGLSASRSVVNALVWRLRPRVGVARAIVVAHSDADWRDLAKLLRRVRDFVVVGNVVLDREAHDGVHQRLRRLREDISACRAETVLLWGNLTHAEFAYAVDVALATGCRLLAGSRTPVGDVEPRGVWIGGRQLVELTPPTLSGWQLALKRGVDLVGAGIGLLVVSPLLLLIAATIRLDSRGPVLFRQERFGRSGRRFTILKFRTMAVDASDDLHREHVTQQIRQDGPECGGNGRNGTFKLVADPRVTRVGRVLRKTSLDELPQLINVLVGEMSLVGPRPPLCYEMEAYEPWQYRRLAVRPGITGLWQVSGRSRLSYFDMCKLDVEYVRTWSVWLDLKILALTVPVVLFNWGRAA